MISKLGQGQREARRMVPANLDARTTFFYQATVNTPAMVLKLPGVGSQYAYAAADKDGNYLDGGKNYSCTSRQTCRLTDSGLWWSTIHRRAPSCRRIRCAIEFSCSISHIINSLCSASS